MLPRCRSRLSRTSPGSPGRVFAFEENDVVDRLTILEDVTKGKLRWSEASGLKQVVRNF